MWVMQVMQVVWMMWVVWVVWVVGGEEEGVRMSGWVRVSKSQIVVQIRLLLPEEMVVADFGDGLDFVRVFEVECLNVGVEELCQEGSSGGRGELCAAPDDPVVDEFELVWEVVGSQEDELASLLDALARGAFNCLLYKLTPSRFRACDVHYCRCLAHRRPLHLADFMFGLSAEPEYLLSHIVWHRHPCVFEGVLKFQVAVEVVLGAGEEGEVTRGDDVLEAVPVDGGSAKEGGQTDKKCDKIHKICQQQLIVWMQRKEGERRSEDCMGLITQEWELVLSGKDARRLVQIMQDYEFDLLLNPIEKNPPLFEKYVWALLASGNYSDLKFLLKRTKEAKHKGLLMAIAEAGCAQNLKSLCKSLTEYVSTIEDVKVRSKLAESTLSSVLGILSKYFINYRVEEIKGWLGCGEEEVGRAGYKVQGGYVELRREGERTECLMSKLKELAVVANRMSKFE